MYLLSYALTAALVLSLAAALNPKFLYHSVLLSDVKPGFGRLPPVVLLHGLLGSSKNFNSFAKILYRDLDGRHDIVVLDLVNHGRSIVLGGDHRLDYNLVRDDVLHTLLRLKITQAHIVGHSFGGKAAAALALRIDEDLDILSTTLLDISPVEYEDSDFTSVLSTVKLLKESQERLAQTKTRKEALDFIKEIEPDDPAMLSFLQSNIIQQDSGVFTWRFGIEGISQSMKSIQGFPKYYDNQYKRPVLLLKGSSSKFVRAKHFEQISTLFPNYTLQTIKDAGHWIHAEQPERTSKALTNFLEKVSEYYENLNTASLS